MTREEIKKAMRDTKREIVIKNLHKLLSLVEGHPEYEDCISYVIAESEQEPCDDAISRQAVLDLINADWKYENLEIEIDNLPSVTPQSKTGHWIEKGKTDIAYDMCGYKSWATKYMCNHCGFIHTAIENHGVYSYCPNCGADMREVEV